ncbi:MAG: glycoside hydrolase family 3 C-terminal domain-containing protein [Firmicutes bacterium]|nr:glycoside hydrolase family 3 C-terminal domain-containing protein [Bacillota bacterium]
MNKAEKWSRIKYQPCLPLGDNNSRVTGCGKHIELSKRAACEGIVLLKNDGAVLPLAPKTKVAVFGKAQIDYVMGGGGSGEVFCEYKRNIYEGLKLCDIDVFDRLSLYYDGYVREQYKNGGICGMLEEPVLPKDLLKSATRYSDTAIITINRYSEENQDRRNDGNDKYFDLSDSEKEMVSDVCENFKNIIVLLNTGAMIDTEWFAKNDKIAAALMIWQGGMEGALAAAEIITGKATPSGKLVDTCAVSLDDYPSTEGFHESEEYVKYTEDIFVGYRYFETIPRKKSKVVYPFGYGLSYTDFEIAGETAYESNGRIYVNATVTNIGEYPGKEVLQLYFKAPGGKLTKPAIQLCAFKKSKNLLLGESETLLMSFDINDMASFDDEGVIEKSAYILEKGKYKFYIGKSVRDIKELDYKYTVKKTTVVKRFTSYCAPENLGKRLLSDGTYKTVENITPKRKTFPLQYECPKKIPESDEQIKMLSDVADGKISLDDFIAQLTDEEMVPLLRGCKSKGVANTGGFGDYEKYGIPAPMTADGPAGVRVNTETGVRTTGFPIATMLACTWNEDVVEEIGRAGALEIKENNLAIWLTPAINIHRSPLCGRNFEYYSEDPYVSGKMAAAVIKGIQKENIVATAKHFACNNKETNRYDSNSILSERALREIYLRGFEICVKESAPKVIMTSYNVINGVRSSENAELITGILRDEWGFKGLVCTDWANRSSHYKELVAGNDIRMPLDAKSDLADALKDGKVKREQLAQSVKRLLLLILDME